MVFGKFIADRTRNLKNVSVRDNLVKALKGVGRGTDIGKLGPPAVSDQSSALLGTEFGSIRRYSGEL